MVIIYKNPVISAIIINIISLIMCIYSIMGRKPVFMMLLVLVGVVNRRIIDNGKNIDKKKKIIIYISFFLMIAIGLFFSFYMNKVRYNQIINGL
jgi:hypothetical protein